MNEVLHDYDYNICVVYLDDILVFSTSLQEHINSLRKIFKRLSEFNLKVQTDKCNFFKRGIRVFRSHNYDRWGKTQPSEN